LNLECDHGSECAGAHQEIIISWNRISLKKDEIFFCLKERLVLDERKNAGNCGKCKINSKYVGDA